jgi:competence protein ComEA
MTSGERKALLFLAGIGVLGAGARLVTAPSRVPTSAERLALQRQLGAVDSAQRAPKGKRERVRPAVQRQRRAAETPSVAPVEAPVDVDAADARALESLPGIGPSRAARLVADRAAHGAFGSLDGLERVRGVGHRLAARLAPRVTFSGVSRPSPAGVPMR